LLEIQDISQFTPKFLKASEFTSVYVCTSDRERSIRTSSVIKFPANLQN